MNLFSLILLFVPFTLTLAQTNSCALVRCGTCKTCIINENGSAKCVQKNGCCPDGKPPGFHCLLDPCRFSRTQCPASSKCIPNYCNGCDAVYYDHLWNELSIEQCQQQHNNAVSNSVTLDPCSQVKCGTCQTCQVNSAGQGKCVYKNGCCSDGQPPKISCLIDPCRFSKSECPNSVHCKPKYCSGCDAIYYDHLWNEIPKNRCGKTQQTTKKLSVCTTYPETGPCEAHLTRYYYDQSAGECKSFIYGGCGGNGNNFPQKFICENTCHNIPACPKWALPPPPPAGCQYELNQKKNGFCSQPELICKPKSEKPGMCPSMPPNRAGICVELCDGDSSCSGSAKCCSNGCGHICMKPQIICPMPMLIAPPTGCHYDTTTKGSDGCPTYAIICEVEPPIPPPSQTNCSNFHRCCIRWGKVGECSRNPSYMLHDCAVSCGLCKPNFKYNQNGCHDYYKSCANWAERGECQRYRDWMNNNCQKSCNSCHLFTEKSLDKRC